MHATSWLPPTATRVEAHTAAHLNDELRERADAAVMRLEDAGPEAIAARLRALDAEWDIERVLQAQAGAVALLGWLLAMRVDRRFLVLPALAFAALAQHALQGWCPPLPLLRRLGLRTVREIERERHALKALRGDFDAVPAFGTAPAPERVRAALEAVDA